VSTSARLTIKPAHAYNISTLIRYLDGNLAVRFGTNSAVLNLIFLEKVATNAIIFTNMTSAVIVPILCVFSSSNLENASYVLVNFYGFLFGFFSGFWPRTL
jgi:hypothetical protein